MAGIFNLFGETSATDKGPAVKPLSRSKTSLGINGGSLKNIGQLKPKGLSIRSNSALNVPAIIQDTSSSKQQDSLKPKFTQMDIGGRPISPNKEFSSKKLTVSCNKMKDVSPKKVFDKNSMKLPKPSDGTTFKKPLPPKIYARRAYPEPENLAPYHDVQFEFDDIYTKIIQNEFKELLMKKKDAVVLYEDEGFESDAEPVDIDMPIFRASPMLLDEERMQYKSPELPTISDDEDDP